MLALVSLFTALGAAISMYVIADRHNTRNGLDSRFDTYVEPFSAATFTALFAVISVPYYFFKMRRWTGLLYAVAFLLGMGMSNAFAAAALTLALRA